VARRGGIENISHHRRKQIGAARNGEPAMSAGGEKASAKNGMAKAAWRMASAATQPQSIWRNRHRRISVALAKIIMAAASRHESEMAKIGGEWRRRKLALANWRRLSAAAQAKSA